MSLKILDDEERLLDLLRVYARVRRRSEIEVFFDGAPPGYAGQRMYGTLRAHFVPVGLTADEAIRRRLNELGRAARNVTVISSDRQVRSDARALQAAVISSEDFARELLMAQQEEIQQKAEAQGRRAAAQGKAGAAGGARGAGGEKGSRGAGAKPGGMSSGELHDWLDLFGIDPSKADQPIEPPPGKARSKKSQRSKPNPPAKKKR